jgi:hypothetical protein
MVMMVKRYARKIYVMEENNFLQKLIPFQFYFAK